MIVVILKLMDKINKEKAAKKAVFSISILFIILEFSARFMLWK